MSRCQDNLLEERLQRPSVRLCSYGLDMFVDKHGYIHACRSLTHFSVAAVVRLLSVLQLYRLQKQKWHNEVKMLHAHVSH